MEARIGRAFSAAIAPHRPASVTIGAWCGGYCQASAWPERKGQLLRSFGVRCAAEFALLWVIIACAFANIVLVSHMCRSPVRRWRAISFALPSTMTVPICERVTGARSGQRGDRLQNGAFHTSSGASGTHETSHLESRSASPRPPLIILCVDVW